MTDREKRTEYKLDTNKKVDQIRDKVLDIASGKYLDVSMINECQFLLSEIDRLKKENEEYVEDRDKWLAEAVRLEEDLGILNEMCLEQYRQNTINFTASGKPLEEEQAIKALREEFEKRRKK